MIANPFAVVHKIVTLTGASQLTSGNEAQNNGSHELLGRARFARTVEWKPEYGEIGHTKICRAGGGATPAGGTSTVTERLSIALLVVTGTC